MLNLLFTFLGVVLASAATIIACIITVISQHRSDLVNQLSHALSDFFAAFSSYQRDRSEPNFFLLVSTVERVRLFCSLRMLPALDSFRAKLLSRSASAEELGRAYRAVADLAREEVRKPKAHRASRRAKNHGKP